MSHSEAPEVLAVSRLTWWKIGLAVLSGLLAFLCFPPADFSPLVWLALVPLFLALTQVRPAGGLVLGLVFGFVFMGLYGGFMLLYGYVPWLAAVLFQTFFFGIFGLSASLCSRSPHPAVRGLSVAATWALIEMFRGGVGGLGFTVGGLGYTQYAQLPLLQSASMIGHFGLSFFIAALNAAVAQVVLAVVPGVWVRSSIPAGQFAHLAAKNAVAGYVVIILLYLWGAVLIRFHDDANLPALEAAVVQASLSESADGPARDAGRALERYLELSAPIPESVDLIVWPEVAVPAMLNMEAAFRDPIAELAVEKSAWVIAGGYEMDEAARLYNSLYAFSPEGQQTRIYRKVILVPFGETVPMRERFPWLARFSLRSIDFSPGAEHCLFELGDWQAGPLICFEALFPEAVRINTLMGADFIIFATSDAWAEGTYEIAQHSATAPLRAVESRRYVVRAGTWGRSMIIAPTGEVLADIPVAEAGAAWATIRPRQELSSYHQWGDAPLQIICALLMFAGLSGLPRMNSCAPASPAARSRPPGVDDAGDTEEEQS